MSTGIWVYDASTLEVVNFISEYRILNPAEIRNNRQWWQPIEAANAVGFSSNSSLFAIRIEWQEFVLDREDPTSEAYTLRIWNGETEQTKSISIECPEKIDSMVFSPDGTILAGFKEGTIYLWDIHTSELQNTLTVPGKVDSILFSPDGATIASTSWVGTSEFNFSGSDGETYEYIDSYVNVWDIRTGRRNFFSYSDSLLGFSLDGRMLAGRIHGDTVVLWNACTGISEFTFTRYDTSLGHAISLAFDPDGLTLASFSDDKIQLWDFHTGNCKSTFTGAGYITSLVFSPDGRTLAGGCEDGTVLLWDVDSGNDETIFTEETYEFSNRRSQIQQICKERGITMLCHFTRIENLRSILQHGLLSHRILKTWTHPTIFNDEDRADRCPEANCLSISFPNYKMFWDLRKKKEKIEGIKDSQWVVLFLHAEILWKLDCAFCQENASYHKVSRIPLENRKKTDALKEMFVENFYDTQRRIWISRQNLSIPDNYPTNPKAEVLVFAPIPVRYIKAIHFWNADAQERWLPNNSSANYETSYTDRRYFKYRCDYKTW